MKAFSHINIGEKISFIIGCKHYLILVVSKTTDIPCANCTRPCAQCTSFNLALQALVLGRKVAPVSKLEQGCQVYNLIYHHLFY